MSVKSVVAVVSILASTAACIAPLEESDASEEAPTSTMTSAIRINGTDAPTPLDHPVPMPSFSVRPPVPRDFDFFWERNPARLGACFIKYATIYDPGRGRTVDIPITICG